jgi:hypothetical protein
MACLRRLKRALLRAIVVDEDVWLRAVRMRANNRKLGPVRRASLEQEIRLLNWRPQSMVIDLADGRMAKAARQKLARLRDKAKLKNLRVKERASLERQIRDAEARVERLDALASRAPSEC